MDAIIVLIGFFIGIAIFLFLMNNITAIVYNCASVAFTFFICWGIGIVLAWIAWKIALIVGAVALIGFLITKFTGSKKKKSDDGETGESGTGEGASPETSADSGSDANTEEK